MCAFVEGKVYGTEQVGYFESSVHQAAGSFDSLIAPIRASTGEVPNDHARSSFSDSDSLVY